MNVGILGLGLIGGSLARAYSKAGHSVYACEQDESMLAFAQLSGAVTGVLDQDTILSCDLILLAIFADGSAKWLESNAHLITRDALVSSGALSVTGNIHPADRGQLYRTGTS